MEEKKVPLKPNPQLDPNFYQTKSPDKFGDNPSATTNKDNAFKVYIGNSRISNLI